MKEINTVVYQTADGKVFDSKEAAERHEQREKLWDELHRVSDAGYGAHSLDDVVDYLM